MLNELYSDIEYKTLSQACSWSVQRTSGAK